MHFNKLIPILFTLVVGLAGCGTGFVDGWEDNEKQGSGMTPAEYCKSKGGHTWINGSCQKNTGLDLTQITEDQCNEIENAYWIDDKCRRHYELNQTQCANYDNLEWHGEICELKEKVECEEQGKWYNDGQCLDRPMIKLTGSLQQNLLRTAQMQPIELTLSEGAVPSIKSTTCEGFFTISEGKLASNKDYKLDSGKTQCEAIIIAVKRTVESLPQTVTVTFSEGFLTYCTNPDADIAILNLAWILMEELKATDCEAAATALASTVAIKLAGDNQISRVDALSGLSKLRKLEITTHLIEDVSPLATLTGLGWLDLSSGKISDIKPLAGLKNLRHLNLAGNPIAVKANKTEANCPTTAGINEEVRKFCLDK